MRRLANELIRKAARLPEAGIDAATARQIARAECSRRGWPFVEPVRVYERLRDFRVWTNARARGGNVEIVVRASDGAVTRAWTGPR